MKKNVRIYWKFFISSLSKLVEKNINFLLNIDANFFYSFKLFWYVPLWSEAEYNDNFLRLKPNILTVWYTTKTVWKRTYRRFPRFEKGSCRQILTFKNYNFWATCVRFWVITCCFYCPFWHVKLMTRVGCQLTSVAATYPLLAISSQLMGMSIEE